MGWFCWIVAIVLTALGSTVEGAIWMLMAVVAWTGRDITTAIRKGAN